MRKKFVKVMLFGALAFSASVSFVGCSDYDDDVKHLQEQIDDINKKAPGVTTEEMTAAVSSAINSLKTELNAAIAGKADNASVVALQEKVKELLAALDNKADGSTVQGLLGDIQKLSEEVNSVKGSLEETKTALEAEIKDLQDKLAKAATAAEMEQIAKDLASAQNKLKELEPLIKDNAAEIVKLTNQIAELATIKTQIEALQASNKDFEKAIKELKDAQGGFLTEADLNKALEVYLTTADFNKLLDAKMLDYLTKDDYEKKETAIYEYVNNTLTATIMGKVEAAYVSLSTYNKGIADLNAKFDNYVNSQSKEYKDLVANVTILMRYKTETLQALVDLVNGKDGQEGLSGKVNALVTAMGDITSLSQTLAGYVKSTELTNYVKGTELDVKIEAYLKSSKDAAESVMQDLEKRLNALEIGVKAMIQSVVYAPQTSTGFVDFNSLQIKDTKNNNKMIVIAENNSLNVWFRVSPKEAVTKFFDTYDFAFEGYQVVDTRATTPQYLIPSSKEVDVETGMVKFVVSTDIDNNKSYAVCMHVTPKAKVGEVDNKDNLTNITSNYFVVSKKLTTVKTVEVVSPAKDEDGLFYNDNTSVINYGEGAKYKLTDSNNQEIAIANYDMGKFHIVYALVEGEDNEFFAIDPNKGILKPANYNLASYVGKKGQAQATVKIDGVKADFATAPFAQVTIGEKTSVAEKTVTYTEPIATPWSKSEQTLEAKFDLNKIYDEANITSAAFAKLTPKEVDKTSGVYFVATTSNAALNVHIDAETKAGSYPIEIVFEGDSRTITVKATIVINYTSISLITNEFYWKGDAKNGTVYFTPELDNKTNASSISLRMDLATLYKNYATVLQQVKEASGELTLKMKYEGSNKQAVSISSTDANQSSYVVRIDAAKYDGSPIEISSEVKFGADVLTDVTTKATIEVSNISGTWKAGKTAVSLTDKTATVNVMNGFSWVDSRDKAMWANGAAITGDDKNGFAKNTNALTMYGLTAPTYKIVDKGTKTMSTILSITTDGKVSFINPSYEFVKDYEATVVVTVSSPWGAVAGVSAATTEIAITVPAKK